MKLTLSAPIKTWDEALPLGNGLQGALLWGEGGTLRFSLDRGDLWDERPAEGNPLAGFTYARLAELVAAGDNTAIRSVTNRAYSDSKHPTKIPAGRMELDLADGLGVSSFELDLPTATARAGMDGEAAVEAIFCATRPVAMLSIPGAVRALRLLAPESVKQLGYPDPVYGGEDSVQWFVQATAEETRYCVCAATRREGGTMLIAATVAYSLADGDSVVEVARERVQAALAEGFTTLHSEHTAWWREFWSRSAVTVPDEQVMLHYHLVQYFYGAASRRSAPPMPLQGVWTADAGELPPWKGDYHHNLNTQMTYMGYQAAGRFDEGLSFLEFMHDLLPAFQKYAREFLETPGAAVPAVMSLAGALMGGWAQYSFSPVNGAWVGHLYYLHWRHTRDEAFLRATAYPWCREVGEALRALLKPDENGVLVLPVSASPEAFNNDMRAWLHPNSNYDIMCMRMLFLGNAEMATALGETTAAKEWGLLADGLGPFHLDAQQRLKLAPNEDLTFSHRHLATVMGIYPFNLLTIEGTEAERTIIRESVQEIDGLGGIEWCGYSYTWMAALRARINDPESALWHLKAYLHAFILRNGFHANGDQTKSGFSGYDYRPFTLEGNFLACAAVHEMLLQSWSARPGSGEWGAIRLFPAMPWRWHDASFRDLVAEGGHRVSARRENNATTWLRVIAGQEGELRIRDNFDGRVPAWNRPPLRCEGGDFVFAVTAGEVLEATLPKPTAVLPPPPVPPPPANGWSGDVPTAPENPGVRMRI